jgi:hypothetical protein
VCFLNWVELNVEDYLYKIHVDALHYDALRTTHYRRRITAFVYASSLRDMTSVPSYSCLEA